MVLLLLTCSEDSRDPARPACCSPARRRCAPDPAAPAWPPRSTLRSFHTTNPGPALRRTRRRLLEAEQWQSASRPPENSLKSSSVYKAAPRSGRPTHERRRELPDRAHAALLHRRLQFDAQELEHALDAGLAEGAQAPE